LVWNGSVVHTSNFLEARGGEYDSECFQYRKKRKFAKSSSSGEQDTASSNENVYCGISPCIYSNKRPSETVKGGSGRGLRQLTRRVCEKVKSKRTTSYYEVANELVADILGSNVSNHFDEKNVRRRVYDALNVLMAVNIIDKNKKEVRWIGLPDATEEIELLTKKKEEQEDLINKKKEQIHDLEAQCRLYEGLIARNMHAEFQQQGADPDQQITLLTQRITLPFIIIHTKSKAKIDCYMNENHTYYAFDFSLPFSICHEYEIVKSMNIPTIRK
ncbi:transcription factor Dp-1-like, partial [Schistocerca gregaria]|uniref:transcription factor Dp-1-like n=1 Tax=Schistocerca gregaria TaxID=7010 RepID=UPI00211EF44C